MATVWFCLVAFMLIAYVLLDGFDLGAGIVHFFVARTNDERRMVLRAIGPVWDGNEVWLLAGGGTLFFAFPLLYASSFSGFYLPLNMVLWLLILRGIGIEFRMHVDNEVWRDFFDGFVHHAGANFHAKVLYGRSNHHKLEAIFKCWARAMRYGCSVDARLKDQLPSTKGLL